MVLHTSGFGGSPVFGRIPTTFQTYLELQTQPSTKRPERRNQRDQAISSIHGHISRRQEVIAIRDGLPPPRAKLRQLLADRDMQKWVRLVQRFAVAIHARYCCPADPFVARRHPPTATWKSCRNVYSQTLSRRHAHRVAQNSIAGPCPLGRQRSSHRVHRRQFHILI